MLNVSAFLRQLSPERVGWFGAGVSAAAVGVVGYQLLLAPLGADPLPGPQPPASLTETPSPTATRTPRPTATSPPTATPRPTSTARPTSTPRPMQTPTPVVPDLLGTITVAEPDVIVGAVATFAARTRRALESLPITPQPR